jgi:molecular chaperone HscB
MKLEDNDFKLFGLLERFRQDRAAVDTRWRELQKEVHPDRFASQGAAAQRVSMQWAVRVNEAYARLKEPWSRAAYLCELRGAPIQAERNTAMAPEFLIQQMAWREQLEEAQAAEEVLALQAQTEAFAADALAKVEHLLDEQHNAKAAAELVRVMLFVKRFRLDLDPVLERFGL